MIEVEDKTKLDTAKELEDLKEYVEKFSDQTAKALKALSDNDHKVIEQVKDALEEILKKVVPTSKRMVLLSDIFEAVLVGDGEVKKMSKEEYVNLIERIR